MVSDSNDLNESDEGDAASEIPRGESTWTLRDRHVAFLGKLGGLTRREAQQWFRDQGALSVESSDPRVDLVIIGADELPLGEGELLDRDLENRAAAGELEILSENELWQRLGLIESDQDIRRLYTPAMLADLLKVSVATIRRWHRRGLIIPVREVHRLPYFDFQEVATARRLSELVSAGVSPAAIERKLNDLSRFVPDVRRPLAQLSVIVQGGEILLRRSEDLIDAKGQRRIDFDALDREPSTGESRGGPPVPEAPASPEELVELASECEDEGRIAEASDLYRAAMAAGGPRPELCFQLAELLYRMGELDAARERYFMAIELDEDYVEARANLGCILAEQGRFELARSAFEGALHSHPDFPDVHYHLARLHDDQGRPRDARRHWFEFLRLAPDSPWADTARLRLQLPE
ncbi:MAG: hypothetical protein RIS70_3930 [Planctomycetota bacterium]|jgi:tetratricopeptide (TPR) repeat protein